MHRLAVAVLFFCTPIYGQTQSTQAPAKDNKNPSTLPYNERLIARGFGNIGRWWSLMSDSDKAAFLDGYQMAMDQAHQHEQNVCEIMRQDISKDPNIPIKAMSEILFMCREVSQTTDYDKVTVKDVDDFYAELLNQGIPVQLSMEWLRDRTRGSKTRGQLIDTLDRYQRMFKISQKD